MNQETSNTTTNLTDKSEAFAARHQRPQAFVVGNVFDSGSARMLANKGFQALAISSWVQAQLIGKNDGESTRAEALAHAKVIVAATDLPTSADLVNGFGDAAEEVAITIREAEAIGLVGGTIEDAPANPERPTTRYLMQFSGLRHLWIHQRLSLEEKRIDALLTISNNNWVVRGTSKWSWPRIYPLRRRARQHFS